MISAKPLYPTTLHVLILFKPHSRVGHFGANWGGWGSLLLTILPLVG